MTQQRTHVPNVPMQAIVQARARSSRLPEKIFEPIGERRLIEWVIHRLWQSNRIDRIVLATGEGEENNRLVGVARETGIALFRGPEEDVLHRFAAATDSFPCEHFCRITGDNPLLHTGFLDAMIEHHITTNADHTAAAAGGPMGATAEVVSVSALRAAHADGREPGHREHVTPFIYTNPRRFRLETLPLPKWMANRPWRLTVDTADDLALMRELRRRLTESGEEFTLEPALRELDGDPSLRAMNATVPQRDWRD